MKYPLKNLLGFGLTLILTAIALVSLNQRQVLQPLTVGMNDWPGYSVILYAEAKGLFTKRGLDVKLVHFEEQNDNLRATMRGYQDASFAPLPHAMQLDFPQATPEFILVADVSAGSDGIVARPGLNFMAQMAGKKISARFGSIAHVILLEALWANDLDLDEVEIVDIPNEEGIAHLKDGSIDAAVLWEPLLHKTAQEIGGNIIYTTAELDSMVVDGLITRAEVVQEKREELIRFIQVWLEVMDAVENNPQEVFAIVAQQLEVPVEIFVQGFQGMIHGDRILNEEMLVQKRLESIIARNYRLLQESCRHRLIIRDDIAINSQPFSQAVERL
ncbi:ABC transporter substrate-binding protein [Synechocystis salina]|uniref:ABC transporter substrate-binding protein n=1 Tax=Synechocystis salina LEGE 00031 TaxID=1828736 RepID=A0ABR9VV12_9SYNC|nr:ABC transporter substrate-binding protein [Synechocystis salina]MBE9241919.1 ABC transporter substrate-binding protein [Synechocystis salina LEGE 00041]MBE9255189.1 ABC transporter substrate-binding protein [Synechocystis salina LEGE 00031]